MSEIEIAPDKLVTACKHLDDFNMSFMTIKPVNIPTSIASKINTNSYYSNLSKAKDALEKKDAITDVETRIKNIITILNNSGLLDESNLEILNNINNFGENLTKNTNIDLSNLLIDGILVKPGDVINIKNQYGTLYKVYVPLAVSKETNITVFYPGTDGIEGPNDSQVVLDYLKEQPNQIIFMSFASGPASGDPMLNSINSLRNQYGINNPINVFGFSRGAQFGEVFARKCISSGIDVKNLILIDPANDGSSLEWQSNGQVISTLKDAGTNVTVFSHNGNDFMRGYSYRHAQEAGLNVNVVSTVTGHNNHPQINRELIENGALDFFIGDGDLKNLNYYNVLDNGVWREMTPTDANKLR